MKKLIFFIIILSITVFISYKYSYRVYTAYLKIYYDKMHNEHALLIKLQNMYNNEKYEELNDFLKTLLIVYPGNDEFKRIGAMSYIKLNDVLKSAELLSLIEYESIKHNPIYEPLYEEIIKALYYNGYYSDVVSFYNRNIMLHNVHTVFCYGVSLYKRERYDDSYKMLMYAKSKHLALADLDFYTGLNLERKGDHSGAIKHVKAAFDSDRSNNEYKKKLADLYRQRNMFKEAAVILRL